MSSQKEIEKDAKTPDTFLTLSETLLKIVEANAKAIGLVVALALIGGATWVALDQFKNYTERKAASEIYEAQSALNKKKDDLARIEQDRLVELSKKLKEDKKGDKAKLDLASPKVDFDKELAPLTSSLAEAIKKHKESNAASVAAIELAGVYLSFQKSDLAAEVLSQIRADSDVIRLLVKMQKATVTLDKGDYQSALDQFDSIAQDKAASFLLPIAILKMGICFEKLNQLDRAKESYSRVSTEFGDSDSAKTAKGFLRWLELNSKSDKG